MATAQGALLAPPIEEGKGKVLKEGKEVPREQGCKVERG